MIDEKKKQKIFQEAEYYLNNDVSMETAAKKFGISKKTFQTDMKKLQQLSAETFKLVQQKKEQNLALGIIKGGQNGKPSRTNNNEVTKPYTMTTEECITLASNMILYDWSLRRAEELTGIPKSTIRENMTRERIGDDLFEAFEKMLENHIPKKHNKKI